MSEIEDYIRDNRDKFEDASPGLGHTKRFDHRLRKKRTSREDAMVLFWRIAAAAILAMVIALSILVPKYNSPKDVHYASVSLGDISGDMANVERYYTSKLAMEYQKIEDLSTEDPIVKTYLDEIEKLTQNYRELEVELYESGKHQRVILAMIENFRLRLDLIETLEKIKNNTFKNDSL